MTKLTAQELAELLPGIAPVDSPAQVVNRVTALFEQLQNPADAEGVRRFMPGIDRTYGLRVPLVRQIAYRVARLLRKEIGPCRAISERCWPYGSREHRLFAVFLLDPLKLTPAECWEPGVSYLPGILTWEDCDQLCSSTTGRALSGDPSYIDALEKWLGDANHWVRRAGLVSTVYLRRSRLPDDVIRALDVRVLDMCEVLLDDREPYIRKAVDWAIRETIGRHYDLGQAWLMDQASAGELSRTAIATLKKSAAKLIDTNRAEFLALLG